MKRAGAFSLQQSLEVHVATDAEVDAVLVLDRLDPRVPPLAPEPAIVVAGALSAHPGCIFGHGFPFVSVDGRAQSHRVVVLVATVRNEYLVAIGRKTRQLLPSPVSARILRLVCMGIERPMAALLAQRQTLIGRIEQAVEQLEGMRSIVSTLERQLGQDEHLLREIDEVLGREPQMRLDEAHVRLRGRRLEEVAVKVLAEERDGESPVHYREWFELLRRRGYLVAGKEPVNTFLAQINRSKAVEKIGHRTGLYRLAS
jgi:hypothetical protein